LYYWVEVRKIHPGLLGGSKEDTPFIIEESKEETHCIVGWK